MLAHLCAYAHTSRPVQKKNIKIKTLKKRLLNKNN